MIAVNCRFRAIGRVLGAKEPRTLSAKFVDDLIWLQLRQILELVEYSAIAADEARLEAVRLLGPVEAPQFMATRNFGLGGRAPQN